MTILHEVVSMQRNQTYSLAWSLGGWRQPLTNMDELGRAQWFRQLRSVKDITLAKTVELYSQGTLSEYPVFKPAAKELGK